MATEAVHLGERRKMTPLTSAEFKEWTDGPFQKHLEDEGIQQHQIDAIERQVVAIQSEYTALTRLAKVVVLMGSCVLAMFMWFIMQMYSDTRSNREAILSISATMKVLIDRDRAIYELMSKKR
jgi:hypothetical protein